MWPHTMTEEKNNIHLKKATLAETSDIYELYEASVQSVEHEIEFTISIKDAKNLLLAPYSSCRIIRK